MGEGAGRGADGTRRGAGVTRAGMPAPRSDASGHRGVRRGLVRLDLLSMTSPPGRDALRSGGLLRAGRRANGNGAPQRVCWDAPQVCVSVVPPNFAALPGIPGEAGLVVTLCRGASGRVYCAPRGGRFFRRRGR
ncbi:hypothetical protein GCM10008939_05250 [Deinococcus aquiradiocola]|uniref:Uncharacterized protein n=1 Tax=Deinococcus aquiradiocola TaxID=393059 RepID=A0A917P6T0_9DEIO|nr:hypothetical protein GCM10008939_05250 [Deinococcus aquiradiocola]